MRDAVDHRDRRGALRLLPERGRQARPHRLRDGARVEPPREPDAAPDLPRPAAAALAEVVHREAQGQGATAPAADRVDDAGDDDLLERRLARDLGRQVADLLLLRAAEGAAGAGDLLLPARPTERAAEPGALVDGGQHAAVRADEAKEGGAAKARRPRRGGEDVAQLVERDPVEERRVLLLHGRDQPDGPGEPEAPALDGPEARALQRGEQAHVALESLLEHLTVGPLDAPPDHDQRDAGHRHDREQHRERELHPEAHGAPPPSGKSTCKVRPSRSSIGRSRTVSSSSQARSTWRPAGRCSSR